MRLILGGSFQGKLDYLLGEGKISPEDVADGAVCPDDSLLKASAVNHLHLLIRRRISEGKSEEEIAVKLLKAAESNPSLILLCDEVGCGIVPVEEEERRYREAVGRICQLLASKAARVDRVFCGLGMILKGEK